MNNTIVKEACIKNFSKYPDEIKRFGIGYGNYDYRICFGDHKFVVRINTDENAYKDTIYWLDKLERLELPVPKVMYKGSHDKFSYLVLNYIDGDDLGNVYVQLSDNEKREIARDIVNIQNILIIL